MTPQAAAPPRVGFIGLGIMGRGMAANLLRAGLPLVVWNRTAARMQPLVEGGAAAAASPADLASRCDIVCICVSDTPDVEAVTAGPDGILEAVRPGTLVVDFSTIAPAAERTLAARLAERGATLLDAPVSGGSEGAQRGTLSIMVGGEQADFDRAKPVFDAVGKVATLVGPVGSGQMVKLVNQILVVINALAVSEALLFAEAGGLDLSKTLAAVEGGAAGSWMLSNRGPQILRRDFRPGFTIDLQQKDVRLVLEAADELGVPLPTTAMIHQLYRVLQRDGLGGDGNHGLVKALERLAGLTVGEPPAGS